MTKVHSPSRITVIIPVLNEQEALPRVLGDLPWDMLSEVVVVDNGSTDATAEVAHQAGARVIHEPRRGYGAACLAGIRAIQESDIVVFVDGDYSDHPNELPDVVRPILEGHADMVIGSRVLGNREPGALAPQARWGNWLAVNLIRMLYGTQYTDLGPFRAIRTPVLRSLGMRDQGFGWTVEMQVRAVNAGLRIEEVPVSYRRRTGHSKISGTFRGCVLAGIAIIGTIFRYASRPTWRVIPKPMTKSAPGSMKV
jgi:glycosyltransferase involved in cell wall biosynthesis